MASSTLGKFEIGETCIELESSSITFQPTLLTRLLAKHVPISKGSTVLDLGCGVGVLAINAALQGAKSVTAIDIMPEACELARANARRNGVEDRMNVYCGDLFDPIPDAKFDIIINDVSGVAEEVARISPWYPPSIPSGGFDGADIIVPMLLLAPQHLNPGGVIYFPTGTISNIPRTLAAAETAFGKNVSLVSETDVPFVREFNENIDAMMRMKDEGLIDFTTRRSRHLWQLQIYKAWL